MKSAISVLCSVLLAAVTHASQAAEKVTVRLSFTPQADHAALHLAKDKGWFSREGFDVDIQDGTGSLNAIQLVASDQIDIAQVQLGGMAIALEKKLPIKSFAGFMPVGDFVVMVPRDSGINTPADLKGKKILSFTGSPGSIFIDSFLSRFKLDRKSVEVTMVAPGAMYNLYSAKEADGLVTLGWYGLPVVEKTRPSRAFLLSDWGIQFPSYGLLASHKTLERRRDMLRKFTKLQIETWEYIWNGHVDEAVQAFTKQRPGMKLDPEVMKAQVELIHPYFFTPATKGRRIGWQARSDWVAAIQSMKEAGVIAGTLKPEDYYTNDFIPK